MEIGMGLLTAQQRPDDPRSMNDIYSEMVELVTKAEEVGLDSVWASEHHFSDDGYLPAVTTTLGAFASVTAEIELGTSMILAPLHDPVRLAEDAATLSILTDDRFTLGLSNGYRDSEFENFGVPKRERANRTEEAITILRRAWSPGPLEYDPLYADVSGDANITPKPAQGPPIILGGTAKPVIRRAALMADGWVAPEKISLESIAKRKRYIEDVREVEHRSDDFTVYVQQYCFVSDCASRAWEQIEDSVRYVNATYEGWKQDGTTEYQLTDSKFQEIKERAIFGSPEDVIDQIERYEAKLGSNVHMILRVYHPGVETKAMENCLELLGEQVAPAVR